MNQGIPFARTIRALDADNFRLSKIGLFLAAAVVAAWLWWAFAARVPQYINANSAQLDSNRRTATAYFPVTDRAALRPGSTALVRNSGPPIRATVTETADTNDGQIRTTLELSEPADRIAEQLTVEIETERVSPAMIALRAAGLSNR